MQVNIGNTDAIIRIILGLVVLSLFFVLEGNIKYISLFGLVLLLTGFSKRCPIYSVIGVNTCKVKK